MFIVITWNKIINSSKLFLFFLFAPSKRSIAFISSKNIIKFHLIYKDVIHISLCNKKICIPIYLVSQEL
jgi:hypothetical protein